MALSCSYIPHNKKGEELKEFQTYRKELGYKTAAKVFRQVLSPTFQKDYKDKIRLDEQNVPVYDSVITIPYIKNLIGTSKLIQTEQKKYSFMNNTRENYNLQLLSAYTFNATSAQKDSLIAVVTPSADGNEIRVEIRERTAKNEAEFQNQYGTTMLNKALERMFGDIGVTVDLLEDNEIVNGRVDFSKASSIADGFKGLISIADGMQGELALPEEMAHLLIGMFRNDPFVQRSLNTLINNENLVMEIMGDEYQNNRDYYSEHPNYDSEGNEVPLEETMAEEALGKLLQEKLKTQTTTTSTSAKNESPQSRGLRNLVQRLVNAIKRIFKGRDSDAITKAKNDVDTSMGELAKEVLQGTKKIDKEELLKARRNARFNQMKEETDEVLKLLKHADEIERKRSKIAPEDMAKEIRQRIIKLEALITDKDKLEGLYTYAQWALSDLQDALNKLTISGTLGTSDFKSLRHLKATLDSYTGFINDFHGVLDEMGDDFIIEINGEEIDLKAYWNNINDVYKSGMDSFKRQALAAFSDYMAPIYEKSPLRDAEGNIKPLRDVLMAQELDISELDRWLISMGNSSSIILQMFDKAVKNAKDKARLRTRNSVREIWKIRDDAEKRGITSFEWIFERDSQGHKTGNYISKYNVGQFRKDERELHIKLEEKYGKHPIGDDFKAWKRERKAWYDAHARFDSSGRSRPNETYLNSAYNKLSKAQLDTLDEILTYKQRIETLLPKDRRDTLRAVQRRRSGVQRITDAAKNPTQAYNIVKESIKDTFNRNEDDDQIYGERTSGLTDFRGEEYLTLPVLYTSRLQNPDELSNDVIGDLMVYADMANKYDELCQTYDPLEIGVEALTQKELAKGRGGKIKEETIKAFGRVTHKTVLLGDNTSFSKKLRDFLECQVYGRYMKEDDIVSADTQKRITAFQRLTSLAYLGGNYLVGAANIATAVGMQNIEAAAREHFSAGDLFKADGLYGKMFMPFMAEITSLKKQSELALFDELFNVKQNYNDKLHNTQMKSIFRRFFGQNWLFVQQGMGDHWIYNRTALAMCLKKKVKLDGKVMSVWDAREIITDKNGYKKMIIKPGAIELDEKGKEIGEFSATAFSRAIAHVNHTLVGIYNDEDMNAANRTMAGRLALQMRQWIVPQMMRRFQSKRPVMDLGKEEEGYYITMYHFAKDMYKSGWKIRKEWDKLSNQDKANCRRAFLECGQTFALWLAVTFIFGGGDKDPDRVWALKFADYMLNRELHELGFLTPGPLMATEGIKTLQSPFVAASAAGKIAQAILTTANPANWFPDDDELIKSGRYEGHSYIYKRWAELPIPPMAQFKQIDRFLEDLDTGTKFYSKDYK